jgi:Holliday junction resolvase RusA-like endonuclease
MTASIVFELDGEPVAKGRPRFARIGRERGAVVAYTPAKTKKYESALRYAAQTAMSGKLWGGPLAVEVVAFLPIPRSWPKHKQQAARNGSLWPTKKPDGDNFLKIALDAMTGAIYLDDAQAVIKRVIKIYSERPRMKVRVYQLMGIV